MGVPVEERIDQLLKQRAKPLPVRPVLPAEHLPQRVLLEQSGIVKTPLIRREDIDGGSRDQQKESRAG